MTFWIFNINETQKQDLNTAIYNSDIENHISDFKNS